MFGLFGGNEKINELKMEIAGLYNKMNTIRLEKMAAIDLATQYRRKYEYLQREHNELIRLINRKGGQEFLDSNLADNRRSARMGAFGNPVSPFTKAELKILMTLVHPDKHGNGAHGKKASEMFIKISNMK